MGKIKNIIKSVIKWVYVRLEPLPGVSVFTPLNCVNHYKSLAHEPLTVNLWIEYSKKSSIIVDVGAHFGFYSIIAGIVNKNANVFAFEPIPQYANIIKRIGKKNGLKITSFPVAIGDRDKESEFFIGEYSDYSSLSLNLQKEIKIEKTIRTEERRLDTILGEKYGSVALMKIDVEGNELSVLRGAKETIERSENIVVCMELSPRYLELSGIGIDAVINTLDEFGLEPKIHVDEQNGIVSEFKKEYAETHTGNIFCFKKQTTVHGRERFPSSGRVSRAQDSRRL